MRRSPNKKRSPQGVPHPIIGALKGTVEIAEGVDLAQPADPEWGSTAYGEIRDVDWFRSSLSKAEYPTGLSPALTALWWAGKDDWDKAHRIVMDEADANCAWVHAYLHRVEGDLGNAGYWYRQAGRKPATGALAAEWDAIAAALLSSRP